MKVRCINNVGKYLSEKAGYWDEYEDPSLIIGKEYVVYSIGVFDDYLFYLLEIDIAENDDNNLDNEDTESIGYPFWQPFEWFEIIDDKMPGIWSFNLIEKYDKVNLSLIWGYKEIVSDYEHHKGLVHHDTKDLEIFYERKKEIDALSM